jgi:hypothetical protein
MFRKGFGGFKEVLQLSSNDESGMLQEDPNPIPNGYGTTTFPQWDWQPGLAMLVAFDIPVAAVAVDGVNVNHNSEKKTKGKSIFGGEL